MHIILKDFTDLQNFLSAKPFPLYIHRHCSSAVSSRLAKLLKDLTHTGVNLDFDCLYGKQVTCVVNYFFLLVSNQLSPLQTHWFVAIAYH